MEYVVGDAATYNDLSVTQNGAVTNLIFLSLPLYTALLLACWDFELRSWLVLIYPYLKKNYFYLFIYFGWRRNLKKKKNKKRERKREGLSRNLEGSVGCAEPNREGVGSPNFSFGDEAEKVFSVFGTCFFSFFKTFFIFVVLYDVNDLSTFRWFDWL